MHSNSGCKFSTHYTSCTHSKICAVGHLTTDAVLASSAHVMQHTMDYLNQKYGSAAGYAKAIGITDSEVSHIRLNLMKEAAPKDLMSRLVDPA